VILAETDQGRGIMGVIDGGKTKGSRTKRELPGARICCTRSATSFRLDRIARILNDQIF